MPMALGKELLELITKLREAGEHPNLDDVFRCMQSDLTSSMEVIENGGLEASWKKWQDGIEKTYPELLEGNSNPENKTKH
jgi:hypothetical protein